MIKLAVVGCGAMAGTWIEYALQRKDTQIVALVDTNKASALATANKFQLSAKVYNNLEDVLQENSIDLVFDITPPDNHINVVTTALKAGCNVFGEKPMASSLAECKTLVELVEKTNLMYAVMQNRRYNKNIRAFRDLVASGKIGSLGLTSADFFIGPHFGGFRDMMDSPLILDMAIHTFDQARMITGADPVSVYCQEFNPAGSWYKGNAAAVCIFELSDGSVLNYRGSWCAEGVPTSWESSWRINGSKGTAMWDGDNKPYAEIVIPSKEQKWINDYEKIEASYTWKGQEGHHGCLDEMFQAFINGRKAETDCRDNIKSMAMVFGALESSKKGEKIKINL